METVTVNIARANVLADMKVKSHLEVASIVDDRERYLAELGSEKEEEAQQCITDAATEVHSELRQLLVFGTSEPTTATDNYDTTATITFTLSVTSRKSPGLAKALANAVHAYVVDSALDKFYVAVARPDFADRHRARLANELAVITNLCYRKFNPEYE